MDGHRRRLRARDDARRRIVTGSVVRDLKGAVVAKLPDAAPAHGAAVDAAGNIYLAQLTGIVQKYVTQ